MRIRRWRLAGGLALALLGGGVARHMPMHLAEDIQKPGHGSFAEMIQKPGYGAVALPGYAIGG